MRQALDTVAQALGAHASPDPPPRDGVDWASIDRPAVAKLRRDLAERYAPSTANKMMAAFRGVLRVCRDRGEVSERQFQEVTRFGRIVGFGPTESRVLSDADLDRLFAACAAEGTAAGRRDAALLTVYLAAGLRREEATGLVVADFDLASSTLTVDSDVPERRRGIGLSPNAAGQIAHWLAARGPDPGPLLLPVDKGGTVRNRRLTAQAVYASVGRAAERAGVASVTPRDLRRTCLIHLIRSGMQAPEIRRRVGQLSWLNSTAMAALIEEAGTDPPWCFPPPVTTPPPPAE